MDIFTTFTNYLLTIAELFGYILGMRWGDRTIEFAVRDLCCICGNDRFKAYTSQADYSEGREKYDVITCTKCGAKYKKEKGVVFRQEPYSDNWNEDIRAITIN